MTCSGPASETHDGVQVIEIGDDPGFAGKRFRRRSSAQVFNIENVAHTLATDPASILQHLVECALDLCSADSAGVFVEQAAPGHANTYRMAAAAGQCASNLNAVLPARSSPSRTCLDRGRPQLYRISERYFNIAGIPGQIVTDGILVPWVAEGARATIWVAAHERRKRFDRDDLALVQLLSGVAAFSVAHHRFQQEQNRQWASIAASAVTQVLARRVAEPLSQLSDLVFCAEHGESGGDAKLLAREISRPLEDLTAAVEDSLGRTIPTRIQ